MNVSIIMPLYKPDKEVLNKIKSSLKNQKFSGKKEIIIIDKGLGLAESINYGIKKSKYDLIVTLHQDCIPQTNHWLSDLVSPLKENKFIASVSDVHLPEELWNSFDIFAKSLTLNEKGTIRPLLDEKGCAYKKSALKKIGFLNEKDFRTSGEDFDLYIKLKKIGNIAYPGCILEHIHPTSFKNRLKKTLQNANGFGALVRIHKTSMPNWFMGVFRAIPLLGIISLILSYPFRKSLPLFFPYLLTLIPLHFYYIYGFWKGFLSSKQTI